MKNDNANNDNSTTTSTAVPIQAARDGHFMNTLSMPTSVSTTSAAAMPTFFSSLARIHIHPCFVIHIFYFTRLHMPRCSNVLTTKQPADTDLKPAQSKHANDTEEREEGRHGEGYADKADARPACTASGSVPLAYLESFG
jgi:hypothetical protein